MSKEKDYYNRILELGIATEEEIDLVTGINGYSISSMDDIVYARTGYADLEQYEEEEKGV